MIVEDERDCLSPISIVRGGNCFQYKGEYYLKFSEDLKVEVCENCVANFNAVNLVTGQPVVLSDDTKVDSFVSVKLVQY